MMLFSSRTASGTALTSTAQQQNLRKLTEIFQSTPENQSCADCGARLSDSIWASTTVGAFLCIHCAGCHRKLGVQLSRVKSVHLDSWSDDEVAAMKAGNRRVYENYGRFADKWVHVDAAFALQPTADIAARERCIRAKYEDLQFTKLPIAVAVVSSPILRTEEKGHDSPENADEAPVSTSSSTSSASASPVRPNQENSPVAKPVVKEGNQDAAAAKSVRVVEVSKRFLNYFVVLGRGALVPNQNIEKSKSPTDIQFFPTTIDAFPEPHTDSPPPSHLGQFAFPEGFSLSQTYAAPVFFSFVLTNVNGVKIYASALKFYEELHPLEVVSLLAPHYNHPPGYHRRRHGAHDTSNGNGEYLADDSNDNQSGELPKWVQDLSGDMAQAPGPVFCPKCIVVTSHYPYFSAFRQFLQQARMWKLVVDSISNLVVTKLDTVGHIYRTTLSQSPMPIERYIANFVSEIPLPPPGLIQVQLTLPDKTLIISRPPKNDFPLVDFSFRPLFQSLDINNILLVFSCVILECKVVLCSKHIALLTPAAETLLALLLPYSWQGAYIPVLPASLLDVIDAPVPFLVGTHSDCLKLAAARTSGVVFVDLDHNRVIPAVDDSGKTIPIPKIPEREGAKLRLKLTEFASIFDPYASGISKVDLAFANEEHLEPLGSFATERGQTVPLQKSVSDVSLTDSFSSIYSMGKIMRGRRNSNANSAPSPSGSSSSATSFSRASRMASQASSGSAGPSVAMDGACGLTESRFNESDGFSTEGIRKAFLRFFVTIFKKYALYLNMSPRNGKHGNDSLFDGEAFLRENHDAASRPFMAQLIATQMFDRFVEDRVFSPRLPEVLFFDQSINQKLNRSLSIGKKKYDCSFLDDRVDDIQETFIAPAPSNIGLPDDGTVYNYKAFPRLKKSLFGNVRKPRELYSSREQQRNISQVDFHQRIFTMSKCIKGSSSSWEATRRLIIHLQAKYRMYSARKQFLRAKHAATTIQRHVKARIQARADRKVFLALRHGAIMFQKTFRMFATRKLYRRKCAALKAIQFFARGYVEHTRYQRAVRGFRRLQAQWRSSFYKKSYKNLKYQLVRVQSRVRGFLSRKQTMRWKQEMFDSFRKRIFDLWEKCDVPLLHRSKFWLTFDRPDFFNLGIYMEEEHRLQAYFRDSHAANDAYEYSTQTEVTSQSGKQSKVRRATMSVLKHMIKPKKRDDRKSINDIAVVRVEEERMQIYEALKRQTSALVRLSFYEQFKIPPASRKKKRRLASMVWNTFDDAGISAEIVVSISASSDRYHPLPAQIDRHKQLRIRDDLAFTVNAALKSIRYAARPDPSLVQPRERELVELQHQVRMLANQNHRLMGELVSSQREMGRLQMELQLQQQPQLRKITSSDQRDSTLGS